MGADYYVAAHKADWPTVAVLNECLAELKYPVRLAENSNIVEKPLRDDDGSLFVVFEKKSIQLEATVTRWSSTESFAYGLKVENGQVAIPSGMDSYHPLDLNSELRKLGVDKPNYEYGDYILSLTFRSSVDEWKAGFLLMSGLIRCSRGLGFEFGEASYGGVPFADKLVREALKME